MRAKQVGFKQMTLWLIQLVLKCIDLTIVAQVPERMSQIPLGQRAVENRSAPSTRPTMRVSHRSGKYPRN